MPEFLIKWIQKNIGGKMPKADDGQAKKQVQKIGNEQELNVDYVILQDWELDFTKKENVDFILKKYKKAQNKSRSLINHEDQIKTLQVM